MNKVETTEPQKTAGSAGQRELPCYANLLGFCDMFDTTGRLDKPFTDGGYDFYTDGHIVVRVKSTGEISRECPFDKSLMPYFSKKISDKSLPIPKVDIKFIGCWTCRGTEFTSVCKECSGEGEVTLDTNYNSYEFECKTCRGDGVTPGGVDTCQWCAGSGEVIDDASNNDVEMLGNKFNVKLISKILALPNIKIFEEPVEPNMYKFVFDGGDGLIMASPA